MATLESMPTEILQKIYEVCPSISDVIAVSSTCRRTHRAFQGSQKLAIIESIITLNYGPIADAIALVTYNGTNTQATPSMSLALARQIDQVGRIANEWADLYPMEKWKFNYESRRLLTSHERYKLRRAVYRIWLYGNTFHTVTRLSRPQDFKVQQLRFVQRFTSREAEEMMDVDAIFGAVLHEVCPHNGIISMQVRDQYPTYQPFFGSHISYLDPTAIEYESWGDLATVERLIGALKKLNPRQLLRFRGLTGKRERLEFLREVDLEYQGLFRDRWSHLCELLPTYLHLNFDCDEKVAEEEVFMNGGVIAADDDSGVLVKRKF